MTNFPDRLPVPRRNHRLVDFWSLTHVAWGMALALVFPPFWAFLLLVLWEPLEIFVLSPLLARMGIRFGHEGWRNSLSDIAFDAVGVGIGFYGVRALWNPGNVGSGYW